MEEPPLKTPHLVGAWIYDPRMATLAAEEDGERRELQPLLARLLDHLLLHRGGGQSAEAVARAIGSSSVKEAVSKLNKRLRRSGGDAAYVAYDRRSRGYALDVAVTPIAEPPRLTFESPPFLCESDDASVRTLAVVMRRALLHRLGRRAPSLHLSEAGDYRLEGDFHQIGDEQQLFLRLVRTAEDLQIWQGAFVHSLAETGLPKPERLAQIVSAIECEINFHEVDRYLDDPNAVSERLIEALLCRVYGVFSAEDLKFDAVDDALLKLSGPDRKIAPLADSARSILHGLLARNALARKTAEAASHRALAMAKRARAKTDHPLAELALARAEILSGHFAPEPAGFDPALLRRLEAASDELVGNMLARLTLANYLMDAGEPEPLDRAFATARAAVALNPRDPARPVALAVLGRGHAIRGAFDEALGCFEEALLLAETGRNFRHRAPAFMRFAHALFLVLAPEARAEADANHRSLERAHAEIAKLRSEPEGEALSTDLIFRHTVCASPAFRAALSGAAARLGVPDAA